MRNINELIGIVKGINFDGVVNDKEVARLQLWVDKNRNLAIEPRQIKLIKLIDSVLEDKIITDSERETVLVHSERFLEETDNEVNKIYELNGIIEGIVCDGEVNQAEVYRLKNWMDIYGSYVRGHKPSEDLCKIVDDILADGIVTEKEQEQLLQMLSARISGSQFETKLGFLRKQVKARRTIGIDLVDILDNKDAMEEIHKQAEMQLTRALCSYTGIYLTDPEIVVISLVLIAMLKYNGNYYENVRKTYVDLYQRFSEQRVEGLIRSILSRYRTDKEVTCGRTRIISVVLENAIVPSNFLPAFFEFIYDIYKLNFTYSLPTDLYGEFEFIYEGLRNSMLSEQDDIQISVTQKTYKLIKSTKKLIESDIDSVIKLSIIIVKLIDKRVWNKEIKIFNPYLKVGYEKWEKNFRNDTVDDCKYRGKTEFRSRWEPKFLLDKNEIFLVPPIHKVKAQYDYRDIRVVVLNGDNQIYENIQPDIREIIGGYQVSVEKIKIFNPLEKVTYKILAGNEIIYDSKEKLHRNFIVFNIDGQEILNNTDYKGTAIFCYQKEHNKLTSFYSASKYKLASQNVKYADAYIIADEVFNFSSLVKPGIFGKEYENHYLMNIEGTKKFPVYKEIEFLVFESDNIAAKYEILINNRLYKLSDFKNTITEREGVCKYVVDLNIDIPGVYCITVNQIVAGKKNRIAEFNLGLDPSLEVKEEKLDENTYMVNVKTDLTVSEIKTEITVKDFRMDEVKVQCNNGTYIYSIPFDFDIYRLSGEHWRSIADNLWIGDLSQDSIIDIYGTDVDGLLVYSSTGELLEEEIWLKGTGSYRSVSVGFLISYKESYDYVMLVFVKNTKSKKAIFCYNKCVLSEKATEFFYDPVTKKLFITPEFYGKGKVEFEIFNQNKVCVYKSGYLECGQTEEVKEIKSFEQYTICFYEKKKGLMLKKNQVIKQYNKVFYAYEDLIGKAFKINEVSYKSHFYTGVYVQFMQKKTEDVYLGKILGKTASGTYYTSGRWNSVEIKICSEVINDSMEVYITKNGERLAFDKKQYETWRASNYNASNEAVFYKIDMNGVELM